MVDLLPDERSEIEIEFRRAAEALAAGNDGKARVCARRAAGVALRAWHRSRGMAGVPSDAQSLLKLAAVEPDLAAAAREAAGRLSATAGPAGTTDPVGDARTIIAAVSGDV